MDRSQLVAFLDYAIGSRSVGSTDGETVETPHSPELRAFVVARLGDMTPRYATWIVPGRGTPIKGEPEKGAAFAALLREVADGIDPQKVRDLLLSHTRSVILCE